MNGKKGFEKREKNNLYAAAFRSSSSIAQATLPKAKTIEFRYSNPGANRVCVAGSFNRWNEKLFNLKKESSGVWKGSLSLEPGIYQYRFIVDGRWVDDPAAKKKVANNYGSMNAVLEVQ